MEKHGMPPLEIGDLRAELPIIQGGMGVGVSLAGLASAVANEGGIGVISAVGVGMSRPDFGKNPVGACIEGLRDEIRKARSMTKGVLGVNLMVASSNFALEARTAIEEGIDVIISGAGLPLDLPSYLVEGAKTKLMPIVSSAKAAALLAKKWMSSYGYSPDGYVVEGPMAGGHLGFKPEQIDDPAYALESILPEVVAEAEEQGRQFGKKIPVIAAGGVYTGGDIHRFLSMGAGGVQMGTRFVATYECDAADAFKQAIVDCEEGDVGIIKSPVGMPGRAVRNNFITDSEKGLKTPFACPYHCIKTCKHEESPYCIALALLNAKQGKLDRGFVFAGKNAPRVKEILHVSELIASLKKEYQAACV